MDLQTIKLSSQVIASFAYLEGHYSLFRLLLAQSVAILYCS